MSSTIPITRAQSSSVNGSRVQFTGSNYDLPGIPHAIQRRKFNEAEIEFEKKKKLLKQRLPLLTNEDISIQRYPYHVILINQLKNDGDCKASAEIQIILRKEIYEVQRHMIDENNRLVYQKEMLKTITDSVKYSWDLIDEGQIMMAIAIRKTMAEHLIKSDDKIWLSIHMYKTCLDLTVRIKNVELANKIKSEMKCILGYLEQAKENNDAAIKHSITLLEESRELSRGQLWVFQSSILVMKLKKPICFVGLREGFEDVNCHSLTIFHVATLLLYEMLMSKACQLVFSDLTDHPPTPVNFSQATDLTERALGLAKEINESTATSTAYVMLGMINKKMFNFEKAIENFTWLQKHANFRRDHESEAVSFNLLGRCHVELNDAVTGLEMFATQREIAEMHNLLDLEADALQHIGLILLEEGQTVEGELCYHEAYERLIKLDLSLKELNILITNAWAMKGIAAGLNFWTRFAGHCRLGKWSDLEQLAEWKMNREALGPIPHPIHHIPMLTDIFTLFEDASSKIPVLDTKSLMTTLVEVNKKLLPNDKLILPTDDKSVQALVEIQQENLDHGRVHFNEIKGLKPIKDKDHLALPSNLVPNTSSMIVDQLNEGPAIVYESDLKKHVVRNISLHVGQSSLDSGSSDKHERSNITIRQSTIRPSSIGPLLRPSVHGGISKGDLMVRPSLNFHTTSMSKHHSKMYQSLFQIHDFKSRASRNSTHSSHGHKLSLRHGFMAKSHEGKRGEVTRSNRHSEHVQQHNTTTHMNVPAITISGNSSQTTTNTTVTTAS